MRDKITVERIDLLICPSINEIQLIGEHIILYVNGIVLKVERQVFRGKGDPRSGVGPGKSPKCDVIAEV